MALLAHEKKNKPQLQRAAGGRSPKEKQDTSSSEEESTSEDEMKGGISKQSVPSLQVIILMIRYYDFQLTI